MDKPDFTPHFAKPRPQQAHLDMLLKTSQEVQLIMEQQRLLNGRIENLHTSILQAITTLCSVRINQRDSISEYGGQPTSTNATTAHNLPNDEKPICSDKPKAKSDTQGPSADTKPIENTRSLRGAALHNINFGRSKFTGARRHYQDRSRPEEEYIKREQK